MAIEQGDTLVWKSRGNQEVVIAQADAGDGAATVEVRDEIGSVHSAPVGELTPHAAAATGG